MKYYRLILCFAAMAGSVLTVACGDEPLADKVQGGYGCAVTVNTRYYKNDKWRDTTYVYPDNSGEVSISRIDDDNVSVHLKATRLRIDKTFEPVRLTDWNYQANLSSDKDSMILSGYLCEVDFSGSVTYDPRAIAVSLRVKDYPNSNGKYIVTFANHNY